MRFKIFASGLLWVLASAASAVPIPFQVTGSSIGVTFTAGGAIGGYSANTSAVQMLDVGESFEFTFGTVFAPAALGTGTGTLTVQFGSPTPGGAVTDGASFSIVGLLIGIASVSWGDPVTFDYSYGGLTGGQFQLDMYDISRQVYLKGFDLKGRITNLVSPTDVPEPGTLALLGAGLLALGWARRWMVRRAS